MRLALDCSTLYTNSGVLARNVPELRLLSPGVNFRYFAVPVVLVCEKSRRITTMRPTSSAMNGFDKEALHVSGNH
jgi:hypothetical protein